MRKHLLPTFTNSIKRNMVITYYHCIQANWVTMIARGEQRKLGLQVPTGQNLKTSSPNSYFPL